MYIGSRLGLTVQLLVGRLRRGASGTGRGGGGGGRENDKLRTRRYCPSKYILNTICFIRLAGYSISKLCSSLQRACLCEFCFVGRRIVRAINTGIDDIYHRISAAVLLSKNMAQFCPRAALSPMPYTAADVTSPCDVMMVVCYSVSSPSHDVSLKPLSGQYISRLLTRCIVKTLV